MSTTRPPTVRLVCIDDNEMIARSLERKLAGHPAISLLECVSDSAAALPRLCTLRPDVALLDLDMPGADAFELIRTLARTVPAVRSVVFSGHVSRDLIDHALDAGAWGYLSKNDDVATIIDGVLRAAAGEIVLSPEAQSILDTA